MEKIGETGRRPRGRGRSLNSGPGGRRPSRHIHLLNGRTSNCSYPLKNAASRGSHATTVNHPREREAKKRSGIGVQPTRATESTQICAQQDDPDMLAWKTWPGTLTEEHGVVSPVRCSQTPPAGGYQNPDSPYPFTQCGRRSAGRPLLHHQGVAGSPLPRGETQPAHRLRACGAAARDERREAWV